MNRRTITTIFTTTILQVWRALITSLPPVIPWKWSLWCCNLFFHTYRTFWFTAATSHWWCLTDTCCRWSWRRADTSSWTPPWWFTTWPRCRCRRWGTTAASTWFIRSAPFARWGFWALVTILRVASAFPSFWPKTSYNNHISLNKQLSISAEIYEI